MSRWSCLNIQPFFLRKSWTDVQFSIELVDMVIGSINKIHEVGVPLLLSGSVSCCYSLSFIVCFYTNFFSTIVVTIELFKGKTKSHRNLELISPSWLIWKIFFFLGYSLKKLVELHRFYKIWEQTYSLTMSTVNS